MPYINNKRQFPNIKRQNLKYILFISVLTFISSILSCQCNPIEDAQLSIRNPSQSGFFKGWLSIEAKASPAEAIQEVLISVRYLGKAPIYKELKRVKENQILVDWDTTQEKDGPYQLEVEALFIDGRVLKRKLSPLWIVNRPAQMRFPECKNQPLIAKDKITLSLEWVDSPKTLPPTPVELFAQGKSIAKQRQAPYKFEIDLKPYAHGQEVFFSAIAVQGIYRGSTAICSVRVDKKGPSIRFVYPDKTRQIIPKKLQVVLQIEEDFGIKEAQILVGNKIVGRLNQPPYQVPIDLSNFGHGQKITLTANAIDRAGNQTLKRPKLQVILDALAPQIRVIKPEINRGHLGKISFQARVTDDAGILQVDFYIEDQKGKRIDNILHVSGKKNNGDLFTATIQAGLSLYGAGRKFFAVEAIDIYLNRTIVKIPFLIGCKTIHDCPIPKHPYRCLGNRCIIPHKLGEQCDHPYSCEPPLLCHFGGISWCARQKLGICRKPCRHEQNCPAGHFCLSRSNKKPICFPGDPCAPFTVNCTPKEQCVPWDNNSFVCLPLGYVSLGSTCRTYQCSTSQNCKKGHACVPDRSGSHNETGTCRKLCDQNFVKRDCQTGSCSSFPLQGKGSNTMGYCR